MRPDLAPTLDQSLRHPEAWYGWTLQNRMEFAVRLHACLNAIMCASWTGEKKKESVSQLEGLRGEVKRPYMHPILTTALARERLWASFNTDGTPWIRNEYWRSDPDSTHTSPGADDIQGLSMLLDEWEEDQVERHPFIGIWERVRAPVERIVGRVRPFKPEPRRIAIPAPRAA